MQKIPVFSDMRVVKLIVLIGLGALIFCAPIKFGLPVNPITVSIPTTILGWLISPWPHQVWQIGIVFLAVIWMLGNIAIGKFKLKYSSLDIPIAVFIGTAFIFTLTALNQYRAEITCMHWISYALCYWLILQVLDDIKDLKWFSGVMLVSIIVIGVYGIFQYYIGLPSTREWAELYMNPKTMDVIGERLASNRIYSTFVYPNTFAGYILLVLPFSIGLLGFRFNEHLGWWKKILVITFIFLFCVAGLLGYIQYIFLFFVGIVLFPLTLVYSLFLTFSKGAFLVFGAAVLFAVGIFCYSVKKYKRELFFTLLAFLAIFAGLMLSDMGKEFLGKAKDSFNVRWEYWIAANNMIKDNPIFGVGPDNFAMLYPKYKVAIAEEVQNTHNNFMQIWVEQGIIGFLAFCGIWITVIGKGLKGLYKTKKYSWKWCILFGLVVGLFAFALHNMGDFDWYVPGLTVIAWVFMGFIVWLSQEHKEKIFVINKLWKKILMSAIVIICGVWCLVSLGKELVSLHYFTESQNKFKAGDMEGSEVTAKVAARFSEKNSNIYLLIGKIQEVKKDYAETIVWYKKALEHCRESSVYHFHLAQAYWMYMQATGDGSFTNEVQKGMEKVIELYPTSPFYRLQIAQFYEKTDQSKKSLENYRRSLFLSEQLRREYEKHGKIIKRLILPEFVIEDIKKKIKELEV